VTRLGNINQSLKVHVNDTDAIFESIQDETTGLNGGFQFILDSNTLPNFKILHGSSEKFRVEADGKVGIGTTDPDVMLDVVTTTYANSFVEIQNLKYTTFDVLKLGFTGLTGTIRAGTIDTGQWGFSVNTFDGSERMRIDTSGNVGITDTSPGRQLTLGGAAPVLSLHSTSTTGESSIYFGDPDDDNEGRIVYSNSQDAMQIFTAAGERIRIKNDGNVGINVTDPLAKLHVRSSASGVGSAQVTGDLVVEKGSAPSIQILSANTQTQTIKFGDPQDGDAGAITYSHASNEMKFRTNGGVKVTVDSSGKVGIGTEIPDYELDVAGEIGIDRNIYHNGDINTSIGFPGNDEFAIITGGTTQVVVTQDNVNIADTLSFTYPTSGTGEFNGEIVKFAGFFGTVNAGDLVSLQIDSGGPAWKRADNLSSIKATGLLGIAIGSSGTADGVLVRGFARSSLYSGFGSPGQKLYVDNTTGDMTITIPTTPGRYVRIVGYVIQTSALSYGTIYFCPDSTYVLL
tara:strand:+ start:1133 stop:2674 length:1542 start_codon:yes stop_codon:yes gene_type:complete